MIVIGLGANLPLNEAMGPTETLEAALTELQSSGVHVVARSPWYESQPVPDEGQPWYVNGVAIVETTLAPNALLETLLSVERSFGRVREKRWASRTVDLDILDYDGLVKDDDEALVLPHPRMHERRFVVEPLSDIAPSWCHPVFKLTAVDILAALPAEPIVRKMAF